MSKHNLEMNKIAAAVLLAGIVALVAGLGSEIIYKGGLEHGPAHHDEAKRGYTIPGAEEFAEGAAGAGDEAEEDKGPVDILPLLSSANLAEGEKLVKRCTACHTFDKGGKNGVGPNQWGVVGSGFAHKADYTYSDALKALHNERRWTFQELSEFLAAPKKHIPGNKMQYAGLRKPEDRANLITYLNTLSDAPLPIPQVAAPAAPSEVIEGQTQEVTPLKDPPTSDGEVPVEAPAAEPPVATPAAE